METLKFKINKKIKLFRSFKIHENNLGMATGSLQQQSQPSGKNKLYLKQKLYDLLC